MKIFRLRHLPVFRVLLVAAPVTFFSVRTWEYNRYAGTETERNNALRDETFASGRQSPILSHPIEKLTLNRVRFEDALEELHARGGVTFDVHWSELKEWGVDPDVRCSVELANVSLAEALEAILQRVSVRKPYLTYRCEGQTIVVSTYEEFASAVVCRMYRVEDLLSAIPTRGVSQRLSSGRVRIAVQNAGSQIAGRVESDMLPWDRRPNSACSAVCLGGRLFVVASLSRQTIASLVLDTTRKELQASHQNGSGT